MPSAFDCQTLNNNKMRNSDFETRFAKRRKLFNIFFILNLSIIIAVIIGAVILGYNIFTNPECVGEFFGRIMKGFSGVQ
jgi:hypothetical protein